MSIVPGTSKGNSKASGKKCGKNAAEEASKRNLLGLFQMCETSSGKVSKKKELKTESKTESKTKSKNKSKKDLKRAKDLKGSKKESHASKESPCISKTKTDLEKKSRQEVQESNPETRGEAKYDMALDNLIEPKEPEEVSAEFWRRKFFSLKEDAKKDTKRGSAELKPPFQPPAVEEDNFLDHLDDSDGTDREASRKHEDEDSSSANSLDDEPEVISSSRAKLICKGQSGDSLALYKFADSLWKPETIVKRSPTGLAASSKMKTVGYPRMTPQKMKQCEDFLKKRAEEEGVSKEEVDFRVGRTRYILGQKIMGLRKTFRRQQIPIPSAEEAQEERKKKKKAIKKEKKSQRGH